MADVVKGISEDLVRQIIASVGQEAADLIVAFLKRWHILAAPGGVGSDCCHGGCCCCELAKAAVQCCEGHPKAARDHMVEAMCHLCKCSEGDDLCVN